MDKTSAGFTALDLVVSLAIVALTLSAGVPALRDYLAEQRVRSASGALRSDLQFARNAAVHGGVPAIACPGVPATGCADTEPWQQGWIVFADSDGDRERGADEPLLRATPALTGAKVTGSSARRRLRFLPDGTAPASNATLRVCDPTGRARERAVRISNSGRIRVDRGAVTAPEAC